MSAGNIYLCGVGGQGIGLLADVLGRACRLAGHSVRGCDTHGVAQRHGVVASHLRLGPLARTPRISPAKAELVVALERLEALRGAALMLAPGGALIYYDAVYQPVPVRRGEARYPSADDVAAAVDARQGRVHRVHVGDLADARMQNVAVLGRLAALDLVPGVTRGHYQEALVAAVPGRVRDANLALFDQVSAG